MDFLRPLYRFITTVAAASACCCVAKGPVHQQVPAEVPINEGAGYGDLLLITLNLGETNGLPFLVDTGSPLTILDRSLEPQLGKPLGKAHFRWRYGKTTHRFFEAPKLYLGDIQLPSVPRVVTVDLTRLSADLNRVARSNHRVMGILGMDCLRDCCLQLDFAAGKMRFLDPMENLQGNELGQAFPLTLPKSRNIYTRADFLGKKAMKFIVDTGTSYDADLTPRLFQQWTNRSRAVFQEGLRPDFMLGGHLYTNLHVQLEREGNFLGLSFLARNLVTFDFPRKTLYLKPRETGLDANHN